MFAAPISGELESESYPSVDVLDRVLACSLTGKYSWLVQANDWRSTLKA